MIHTRICDLLGIPHPIVLGGMGNATTAPLVAAVSNAGVLARSALLPLTLRRSIARSLRSTNVPTNRSASIIFCSRSARICSR